MKNKKLQKTNEQQTNEQQTENIGISPRYAKNWTIEEAIREVLQNYVDCREEFNCEGYITWKDGVCTVHDDGNGLELKHLVMGISEKSKSAIGQFGEGLKLALLVFARDDRKIQLCSRGKKITPIIRYSSRVETELISLNIEEMTQTTGTTIKMECTKAELEQAKQYFTYFQDPCWVLKPGQIKDIALSEGDEGTIWVNGSKVGHVENALFGYHFYNLKGQDIVTRDRGVVDLSELSPLIRNMFLYTRKVSVLKKYIAAAISQREEDTAWETQALTIWKHQIVEENLSLWRRSITEVAGKKIALSTSTSANRQAVYAGYKILQVNEWSCIRLFSELGVPTSEEINSKGTSKERIAQKDLDTSERINLRVAKQLIKKYYNTCGRVIVVNRFIGHDDIEGQYKTSTDEIFILRQILSNRKNTAEVLLHEAVHKHSGANDCTVRFQNILTEIAVDLMMKADKE